MHLKFISELRVIVLSIVLLTGISLVPALQIGVYGQVTTTTTTTAAAEFSWWSQPNNQTDCTTSSNCNFITAWSSECSANFFLHTGHIAS